MVEQVKFDYSPLGKVFNKGLTEDKKEELLKSVNSIGDKNKELPKEIKNQRTKESGNSNTAKIKNSLIYDQNHNFYKYRLDKFSSISSIDSKFDMLKMFHKEFISLKSLEARMRENTNHKLKCIKQVWQIKQYKKVYERNSKDDKSYSSKQKYSPNWLKALDYQPVKPKTKPLSDENKLDIKQPTQLKQLKLNEIPKPLWITLSRKDFNSLVKDVVDNLDSED